MYISRASTTREKLVRIARKCGFFTTEGSKHILVKTSESGDVITTIPRHKKRLNKYTVGAIAKRFQEYGCNVEIR